MHYRILPALVLILYSLASFAQAPAIQWQKSYGGSQVEAPSVIRQTTDGGYIIGGISQSSDGDVTGHHGMPCCITSDYWIVKTTAEGTIEWEKSYGGTMDDFPKYIQQTADGGYIVAGNTSSDDGDITMTHGMADCWIVKLSATGGIEWEKDLGGSLNEVANYIQQTTDGGYIIAGITSSPDGDVTGFHPSTMPDINDWWVIKLSATGNLEWENCYGSTGNDQAHYIYQTADGGYFVAGTQVVSSSAKYTAIKLSPTGAIQWQKSYGGTSSTELESAAQTTDGGYILAGTTYCTDGDVTGNHGMADIWVVKINATGSLQWQKCLGGSQGDYAFMIRQTANGGYVVAGSTFSQDGDIAGNHGGLDAWIVQLSALGSILWQKCIGGSGGDDITAIEQTADMGFILAGSAGSSDGDLTGISAVNDYWVVKLAAAPVGISELHNNTSIALYPNPAKDAVTVIGATASKIQVYSIAGRLMKEVHDVNNFSITGLPPALYFVKVFNENNEVIYQAKLVKE